MYCMYLSSIGSKTSCAENCMFIMTLTECIFGRVHVCMFVCFCLSPGVWMQKAHEVEQQSGSRGNPEYVDRVKLLEKEVSYYKDEANKAQTEVERLLDILREVETEKNDKDKKIAELER